MKGAKRIVAWGALVTVVTLFAACPPNDLLTNLQEKVQQIQSDTKAITAFSITSPVAAQGTITGFAISVTVPYGTNVTSMVANFTTTGASVEVGSTVQTTGVTANNFTNPVVYTVTAGNGSTQNYTVTVTVAKNPAKAITAFSFPTTPVSNGVINQTNFTIAVTVPYGTVVTALVANFTTTGASVEVGSTVQTTGVTANNFTNPVVYTVTAADGSTQNYTVSVSVSPFVNHSNLTNNWVTSVAIYGGSTIYAGTYGGGLAVSGNNGSSWTYYTTSNSALGDNRINGVAVSGFNICVVSYSGGLFVSGNGGSNWTTYTTANTSPPIGSNYLFGVAISGSTIYAATNSGGLSISTNGGSSWTTYTTANGLGSNYVYGVAVSSSMICAATSSGVSISTNLASSPPFTNYTNGLGNSYVLGVAISGSTIYAATNGGGLSVSTTGGSSWTTYTTANGLGSNTVYGVAVSGSTVYAATAGGLSVSTNLASGFANYTTANGLGSNAVYGVTVSGSTIYAATLGGLSISQ